MQPEPLAWGADPRRAQGPLSSGTGAFPASPHPPPPRNAPMPPYRRGAVSLSAASMRLLGSDWGAQAKPRPHTPAPAMCQPVATELDTLQATMERTIRAHLRAGDQRPLMACCTWGDTSGWWVGRRRCPDVPCQHVSPRQHPRKAQGAGLRPYVMPL